jgi:hypothetical protein
MRELFPTPPDPLDALVRSHLEVDGRAASPARVVNSVLANLDDRPTASRPRRRMAVLRLAVAAALLLGLFAVTPRPVAHAGPGEVVRQSQKVHQLAVDRCYVVRTEPSDKLRLRLPRHEARLWTRGDRFWVEPAFAGKGVWGRDEHGRTWVVPSPSAGLRYDADEIPESLARFIEVRAVRLPTLLGEVLRDCDLALEENSPPGVRVVLATSRAGTRAGFAGARIEVAEETGVVRRLVLRPRVMGKELAVVTLTLQETCSQPDDHYRAEGHLLPGAPVHDRTDPRPRRQLLLRALEGIAP